MTNLRPFSGDKPRCSKCGMRGAHTEWKPHTPAEVSYSSVRKAAQPEHLRRTCIRCGYWWREDIVRP